jgi:hypothetical protein
LKVTELAQNRMTPLTQKNNSRSSAFAFRLLTRSRKDVFRKNDIVDPES